MRRVASILLATLGAGCGGQPAPVANCSARPADFRSFAEPNWSGPGIAIEPPRPNRIEIGPDGLPVWNGVPLGGLEDLSGWTVLDRYLGISAQLEPMPFVTLVFPQGASCAAVARARGLIRRHLPCGPDGRCFQGPPPR